MANEIDRVTKRPRRVKHGYTHGMNNEHREGDIVHLTDYEVLPIRHKFEDVQGDSGIKGSDPNPNPDSLERVFGEDVAGKLRAAGLASVADVRGASDKDLKAIEGIGDAKLKQIRAALGEE